VIRDFRIRRIGPENDKPASAVIGEVMVRTRKGVYPVKIAGNAEIRPEAFLYLVLNGIRIPLQRSALSSASLVTVGWVEYQKLDPSW
jgi:hypothetical protein